MASLKRDNIKFLDAAPETVQMAPLFVPPSPPACKRNYPNDRREPLAFLQFVAGNHLNSVCPQMHHAADGDQEGEVFLTGDNVDTPPDSFLDGE